MSSTNLFKLAHLNMNYSDNAQAHTHTHTHTHKHTHTHSRQHSMLNDVHKYKNTHGTVPAETKANERKSARDGAIKRAHISRTICSDACYNYTTEKGVYFHLLLLWHVRLKCVNTLHRCWGLMSALLGEVPHISPGSSHSLHGTYTGKSQPVLFDVEQDFE